MSSGKASKATKAQKPAGVDIRAFMTARPTAKAKTGSSVSGSRFIPSLWVENTRSSRQRQAHHRQRKARVKWRVRNLTLGHQSAAYQVSIGSSEPQAQDSGALQRRRRRTKEDSANEKNSNCVDRTASLRSRRRSLRSVRVLVCSISTV